MKKIYFLFFTVCLLSLTPLLAKKGVIVYEKNGYSTYYPSDAVERVEFINDEIDDDDDGDAEDGDFSDWAPFGYDVELGRDGLGTYNFRYYYSGTETVLVESRHRLDNPDKMEFRFQWMVDYEDPSKGWETFITAKSRDGGNTIEVPKQIFAYNSNYGDVYVSDLITYTDNNTFGESYFNQYYGIFYLNLVYYVDAGYFGYGYETCQLNGYADPADYNIYMSDMGQLVIDNVNYQMIDLYWTNAVSYVAYTVVDLSSIQDESGYVDSNLVAQIVNDIKDGKRDATVIEKQGLQALSFPKSGKYTLIAASFKDENNGTFSLKASNYISFEYKPNHDEGWNRLGFLEYTDGYISSAYLTGITSYYVEVQESVDYPGYYRLVDPYGAAYPYNDPGDWDASTVSYLYFDVSNPQLPYVDFSPQTLNWGDGDLYCYSQAANQLAGGDSMDNVISSGLAGIWKDNALTFPAMALMASYDGGKSWYMANSVFDVDLFEQTGKAELMVDANGNYVAPFKVDFNTLTNDPLAVASTAGTRAEVSRMHKEMINSAKMVNSSAKIRKNPASVKYTLKPFTPERHSTMRQLSTDAIR